MEGSKKEKILSLLRPAGFVLLFVIIGLIVYLIQQEPERSGEAFPQTQKPLTDEQKKEVLESLSAPAGAPKYTDKEKQKILEDLSAPSGKTPLSEEEKKKILESLSVPQE